MWYSLGAFLVANVEHATPYGIGISNFKDIPFSSILSDGMQRLNSPYGFTFPCKIQQSKTVLPKIFHIAFYVSHFQSSPNSGGMHISVSPESFFAASEKEIGFPLAIDKFSTR